MLDVFKNDAFSMTSLTTAINKLPFAPSRIGALGLFTFKGVPQLTVAIEEKHGTLALIPTAARGSHANVMGRDRRKLKAFPLTHIPLDGAVMADDVQGVRAFGSEDQVEGVAQVVNEKLTTIRQWHEVTNEYHRVGCIQGKVLDADGASVLYDWFDEFGITETEVHFDLSNNAAEMKLKTLEVIRAMDEALGGTVYSGIQAFCGDEFFDGFVTHPSVKDAFHRWQDGQFFRDQQRGVQGVGGGFQFAGISWENYRGKIDGVDFVPTDNARFVPLGVFDLFQHIAGPANFVETVNTPGLQLYAKQAPMKFDEGVELHTQQNPMFICTRPACLIKGNVDAP